MKTFEGTNEFRILNPASSRKSKTIRKAIMYCMPEKEKLKLPDSLFVAQVFKSTFLIGERDQPKGTAFVVGRPSVEDRTRGPVVLVTAAHVLKDIQSDEATINFRSPAEGNTWNELPKIIQIRRFGAPLWTEHREQDVAVMQIELPSECGLTPLALDEFFVSEEVLKIMELSPGDTLLVLGYPWGHSSHETFPILRGAHIAGFPIFPFSTFPTFFLDFQITTGNSGGPVILPPGQRGLGGGCVNVGYSGIVGMVTSQMLSGDDPSEVVENLRAAVAVHSSVLRETIELLPWD